MSASDIMLASSRISSDPRLTGSGPRASRRFAEVAEEPGGVVGAGHARLGQDVAGGLGGGQADHLAHARLLPDPGHLGDGAGLARPGRAGHHLGAAAGGKHREGGGGLIEAQPGRDPFKA